MNIFEDVNEFGDDELNNKIILRKANEDHERMKLFFAMIFGGPYKDKIYTGELPQMKQDFKDGLRAMNDSIKQISDRLTPFIDECDDCKKDKNSHTVILKKCEECLEAKGEVKSSKIKIRDAVFATVIAGVILTTFASWQKMGANSLENRQQMTSLKMKNDSLMIEILREIKNK